ncbi:gamma-glutamylcyclotransferase [Candidatus Azambacteria bacterium]|nr:gamma-glutamylcyclotransferase [Candidatus Azambacteria bacterium]
MFVYGSLRDSALCRKLLERRVGRMRAVLPGFRRARIRGYAYPVARKESKATIRGVLLLGLSKADMKALDAYEEIPHGPYRRITVFVLVANRPFRAFTYTGK